MESEVFKRLQEGISQQQQGDLQAAEQVYRQILEEHPEHPDALHLLGVLAYQIGEHQVAEDLITRAIESGEMVADYHNNLGEVLRATGRLDEAITQYETALSIDAEHINARQNLDRLQQHNQSVSQNATPPMMDSAADMVPPVRHALPSYLLSLDDEPNCPSQTLVDLALLAAHRASKLDLDPIKPRFGDDIASFLNVWPGEHYRLLAALIDVLQPRLVIEIGTATGASALTIKNHLPADGKIITYDVISWREYPGCGLNENDFDQQLEQRLVDLSDPTLANDQRQILEQADFIFADAAKDNIMEAKFCQLFDSLNFHKTPIIMFDDIRTMPMLKVWRSIQHSKLDLTSFGHWSGSGLVEWNNNR